jgi:competence protein ComEA
MYTYVKYYHVFGSVMPLNMKIIATTIIIAISIILYITKSFITNDNIGISENGTSDQLTTSNSSIISTTNEASNVIDESTIIPQIIIDISGEVLEPKIITLPEGSRVYEAIQLAGGLKKTAAIDEINQAAILNDGEKIIIPKIGAQNISNNTSTTNNTLSNSKRLININTADAELLDSIQGVGPTTAQNIINYRTNIGKFTKIEDIKNVTGIGDKTFEKLKGQICVK